MGANAPIFIVGLSRSGTTLCSQILNNHPRIAVYFESFFLQRVAAAFPDPIPTMAHARQALDSVRYVPGEGLDLDRITERFFSETDRSHRALFELFLRSWAEAKGKSRFGEKMPSSFQHFDRLLEWFPRAKVLFLVRDPRDVHSSYKRSGEPEETSWANSNVVGRSLYWNECLRTMELALTERPQQVLKVSFRELVTSPEATARAMCAFLGESFCSEMIDVSRSNSSFDPTKEGAGIRQDVLDRRSYLSSAETMAIELVCGEGMLRESQEPTLVPDSLVRSLERLGFYSALRRGHALLRLLVELRPRHTRRAGPRRDTPA